MCCHSHEAPNEGYNQAVCANGGLLAVEIINILFSIINGAITGGIALALTSYAIAMETYSTEDSYCQHFNKDSTKCNDFYKSLQSTFAAVNVLAIFNYVTYLFAITGVILASIVCCACKCCCSGPQQTNKSAGIFQIVASAIQLAIVITQFVCAGIIGGLANSYEAFCKEQNQGSTSSVSVTTSGSGASVSTSTSSADTVCKGVTDVIRGASTFVVICGIWSCVVLGMRIFAAVTLMQSSQIEYVETATAAGATTSTTTVVVNAQPVSATPVDVQLQNKV